MTSAGEETCNSREITGREMITGKETNNGMSRALPVRALPTPSAERVRRLRFVATRESIALQRATGR